MRKPEDAARKKIDFALSAAGWAVQDYDDLNLDAERGIAVRNFPLAHGHGFADYILYVDGEACGVLEAKPEGTSLTGVEPQSEKYAVGSLKLSRPRSGPSLSCISAPASRRC